MILVQSLNEPDWEYAFQYAPYLLSGTYRTISFEPSSQKGDKYHFRLLANVTTRKWETHTKNGEIQKRIRKETPIPEDVFHPLPAGHEERMKVLNDRKKMWTAWLHERAGKNGFMIDDNLDIQSPYVVVKRKKAEIWEMRYNAVLFNGTLVCKDPNLLNAAVVKGIGRARAFGFGLLSLARG